MNSQTFCALPAWQKLKTEIEREIGLRSEALDSAQDFAAVRYELGWRHALTAVLELPAQVLKDENEEGQAAESPEVKGSPLTPSRPIQPTRRF